MKYMAKYYQVCWDDDVKPVQKQCQQTLKTEEVGELCSIACKDNYSNFENTISPNIISKGFFQTAAQKALQNSEIEKAFEIISVGDSVFSNSLGLSFIVLIEHNSCVFNIC